MVHSRLPPASLLCLFGAPLMLYPELLMGNHEEFYNVNLTDPGVQEALAFAVEKFNRDRDGGAPNYFKVLRVLYLQMLMTSPDDYHFTVDLVKTTCIKRAGKRRKFKRIQECKQLPGKNQQRNCYFVVGLRPPLYKMKLIWTSCYRCRPAKNPSCSG